MSLKSQNALVFAATGAIGSGVARKFAEEGATVWLSGRDSARLETLADEIRAKGGTAHTHVVDATDPVAVKEYFAQVAESGASIDIVFNGIGLPPAQLGYPERSTELEFDMFMKPLEIILGSTFLTARTAGEYMARQRKGAIVTLSATLSGMTAPNMANITATCGAIEALTRSLAGEFGPSGVRVNCVRGSAMPETRTIQETGAGQGRLAGVAPELAMSMSLPPLGRPITVAETAATAAFLASPAASGMTGQVVTVCAGAFVG
jgi:3-oxoacyl-[acyl-carrier protein] reductase